MESWFVLASAPSSAAPPQSAAAQNLGATQYHVSGAPAE